MSNHFLRECVDFWSSRVCETEIGCDWSDAEEHCWRCGYETKKLQKCHVVAKQFGGSLSPENVVLLCRECHDEAPDVTDSSEMWRWIKETRPKFGYGTLKAERAFAIAVSRGVDLRRFNAKAFQAICHEHVGLHLMQNGSGARIKASSFAWAIEKACQEEPSGQ